MRQQMTKQPTMKRKVLNFCDTKYLSDTCATIVLTVFVFSVCLLMFTYADSTSNVKNRFINSKLYIPDEVTSFAVKQYTWKCQEEKCVRTLAHEEVPVTLDTCNMLCTVPPVWPKPHDITVTQRNVSVINRNVFFNFSGDGDARTMLENATDVFVKNLQSITTRNESTEGIDLNISIVLQSYSETRLKLATDESYHLLVQKREGLLVEISAQNFFGARHALETLSQLIWYDETDDRIKILHDVHVKDYPHFPYRGVMVDTARNFFSVKLLKKVIDGMAMSKLNVFHLHLTDAVSFSVLLPKVKELAEYGAYGPDKVHTPQDIKELKQYALVRGIRLVLEVDAPSHVNAGWNYAKELYNEDYVICGEEDVLNGHLNPDNPHVLRTLENIYSDLLDLTEDDEIFHIGADEVNLDCWRKTKAAKGVHDMEDFWAQYTNKMLERLKNANNGKLPDHVVMWSSPLTASNYFENLDANITVQFWLGNPRRVLTNRHHIIYSTVGNWYLDCGFGPWKPSMDRGVCDPYTPWETFYKYRPWKFYGSKELALGGEVCLWTEQVDVDTLETRVWPRTAAFAERVWSDPVDFDDYDVYTRLVSFRERLISRGVKVSGMWPRWCSQNPGRC